jgi:O-antigen/teichoic acid export membrane protein
MTDERTLLAGTGANVIGLAGGVAAALGVQLLLGRQLPHGGLALVTIAVQVAFVAAAGARFGMDLAAVRTVAIGEGRGDVSGLRSLVDRCAGIAFSAGVVLAVVIAAAAPLTGSSSAAIAIGAASLPLVAVTNVYLGATRGRKRMGPTLWVFWIGQPVAWIALAVAAIAAGGETNAAVLAYDLSWLGAAVAARVLWRRSADWPDGRPATRDEVMAVLRYGAPRAPSALLAQALFWGDLFVLAHFESGRTLDAYAASGRISQLILLFLTSVNLVFSPFAADLHARGERARLDSLFKRSTRWALAATLPLAIVLFVAAPQVLQAFGPGYEVGSTPLRIMLVGQTINVATGGVAFVLVMAGYTGVDLLDNVLAAALLFGLAIPLASADGPAGAAAAAATALACVNLVRLAQVWRLIGIQPFDADYGRLVLPSAACALAAWAARSALESHPWWLTAAAAALAGTAAYAALLPAGLPAAERASVADFTRRISNRPR